MAVVPYWLCAAAPWCVLLFALIRLGTTPWIFFTVGAAAALAIAGIPTELLSAGIKARGLVDTPEAHQTPLPGVDEERLTTLFYPGLGSSWMQALRYTGKWGFAKSPTLGIQSEHMDVISSLARMPNAPRLLVNIHPMDPPEAVGRPWWSWEGLLFGYTLPVTALGRALNGIVAGEAYALAWPRVSFAQHADLDRVRWLARMLMRDQSYAQDKFVLAGSSRGASTVLGAVTQMSRAEQDRIAFVLVEGGFDSVPAVAEARYGRWLGPLVPKLLSWLTQYDPAYPSPLEMAAHFPAHVPILFVTSKADWDVPMVHTLRLRDAVVAARQGNTTHVHTLILERSHHSFYVNDDLEDQMAYRHTMVKMHRDYAPHLLL